MSFRFQIGDMVSFRGAKKFESNAFMVVERVTAECHGGTQFMYVLRGSNVLDRIHNICDFELEPFGTMSKVDPMELLSRCKEEYVASQNFPAAAIVRDVMNAIKESDAMKAIKESVTGLSSSKDGE